MKGGRLLAVVGSKGGVGTSLLTSLCARVSSKQDGGGCALVDAYLSESSHPSLLALSGPSRALTRLKATEGPWNRRWMEGYFTASSQGILYAPLAESPDDLPALGEAQQWVEKLRQALEVVWLDLSGFDLSWRTAFLESAHRTLAILPADPLGLSVSRNTAPRLVGAAGGGAHVRWAINPLEPRQGVPRDAATLPLGVSNVTAIPHGGPDLGLNLREGGDIPRPLSKAVESLAVLMLEDAQPWRTPLLRQFQDAVAENAPPSSPAHSLGRPTGFSARLQLVNRLHQDLLRSFREKGILSASQQLGSDGRDDLEPQAREILENHLSVLPDLDRVERKALLAETLQLAFGLGPLEPFLQDETITEIMVNGAQKVFLERGGLLEPCGAGFMDESQLRTAIDRILSPLGRRVDEGQPTVDGRLMDGSRVNVVIPPIALDGAVLTIRKFPDRKLGVDDLVRLGALTPAAAEFLGLCVKSRKNIVVSGGTGSGKTTLLNILSSFIPPGERIVTIEDSAELKLRQEHVVRLEARPANLEGKGRVSIRDLVINSLRMRPDRIVVGEVRGGEALDMLQAMNTGHDGSLTTCHANTPRDALSRLETMCLMAGMDLPLRAVREQVVRAVHLVVQISRMPGGKRAITHITEVQGMEGDTPVLQDLFKRETGSETLERMPFRASFETAPGELI